MNKQRRKSIADLIERLNDLRMEIVTINEEEQEAFDAMPEGLQSSERGEMAQAAIDALESASDSCEEALSQLEEAST